MSASRKKQERKIAEAPELSAREQEEMNKAAQRKRNTIVYSIIGVVVVILAAILLIWDSGVFQRNASVATIDGEKVTSAQVAFHYYNNPLANVAANYAQYGLTMPYSPSESAKDQVIEAADVEEWASYGYTLDESYVGKTYHDYFLDAALETLRSEYAVLAAAKDAGYTSKLVDAAVEAEMDALDSTIEAYLSYGYNFNVKTYLKQLYGKNMTVKAFRTCVANSELAEEYYSLNLKSLADFSETELNAYYQEHTNELDSVHFYFRTFDGTAESHETDDGKTVVPTDEETKAAMAKAKEEADAEAEKVKGNLSAVENSEDYTEQKGRLTTTNSFYYDWVMDPARQAGDSTVFEGTNSYYVVVFSDRFRDETTTADVRHILVEAKNEDDPATEDVNESTETPTDEVFAAAEKKAQELLAQWESGDKTSESFALLANEYSADTGSNTNGGLYPLVAPGEMIPAFNDWVFADGRKAGDTGLVKNTESYTQGWHIILYLGDNEPTWAYIARQALWSAEVADTMEIVRTNKLDATIG